MTRCAAGLVCLLVMAVPSARADDFASITIRDDATPTFLESNAVASADGTHVYGASYGIVRAYRSDPGGLVVVDSESVGAGGGAVAASADGFHVYATGGGSSIRIFARDPVSGALDPLDTVTAASAGVPELAQPSSLAIAPDGAFVYAGCLGSSSIVRFSRSPETGALSPAGVTPDLPHPIALHIGADDAGFYVATLNDDSLRVFARDPVTGELLPAAIFTNGVDGVAGLEAPARLAIPPDGRHLYVGADGAGGATFARDVANGALTFIAEGPPGSPVAGDRVIWSYFFESGPKNDYSHIAAYARDPESGLTSELDLVSPGVGSPVLLSPDGDDDLLYGGFALRLLRGSGFLRFLESDTSPPVGPASSDRALQVEVTPDARSVLALTSTGLTVHRRNGTTGRLAFVEKHTEAIPDPRQLVVSPDARFVYVADASAGIVRFARDESSGALAPTEPMAGVQAGGTLAITIEGGQLYAYRHATALVDVYGRDATTGSVVHASSAAIGAIDRFVESPTPQALYAIGSAAPRGRGWFRIGRDSTGTLGAADFVSDIRLLEGLAPYSFVNAFVGSAECFGAELGPCWGDLGRFVNTVRAETGHAPGLLSILPSTARLSPDRRMLYVGSNERLIALAVDPDTLELSFVDGALAAAKQLAVSPDGASLYALDESPTAIRTYAVPEPAGWAIAFAAVFALRLVRSASG